MKELTCPHLAVFGRLDGLVPHAAAKKVKALSPNTHIKIINKAAHAPFLSHTEEFLDILKDFLK